MGGTNWSSDLYKDRKALRAKKAMPTFGHDHDVKAHKIAPAAHKTLDPKGVVFRESRDSDVHPESIPIAVLMDVTGSMQEVPKIIQANLPRLMGLLILKGYVEHPAIFVGAIGDATCDTVPLQVGQFESGIEIEDCLTNLYLEGGGGGHITESYELGLYFLACHTVTDHWEKRGQKGYLFVIGDETPYPKVKRDEVLGVIGDTLDQDIPTPEVIRELQERWETFFILPQMTSHWGDRAVIEPWKKLLPQRVIELEDPATICECIAGQIGLFEAKADPDTLADDLVDAGTDRAAALSVGRALVPAGSSGGRGSVQKVPSSGDASGLAKF